MPVSWLSRERLPSKGNLGLTHSPGAVRHARDAELNFLARKKVQTIVCLQEANEFPSMLEAETLDERRAAVEERGMAFIHEPILDFGAPRMEQAEQLCALIGAGLDRGERWVMHCWAGLGRAGTIAACLLVERGLSADEAVAAVRADRPGAIQSAVQLDFIRQYQHAGPHQRRGT